MASLQEQHNFRKIKNNLARCNLARVQARLSERELCKGSWAPKRGPNLHPIPFAKYRNRTL